MSKTQMRNLKQLVIILIVAAAIIWKTGSVWAASNEEDTGPVITKQPESVEVNYPKGATFHVEVENPDNVESYRWEYTDGYHVFKLDGTSASTDTLVIPSTMQDDPEGKLTCIIKGKNGVETVSEPATIKIVNPQEDKTVLYVGDYAVLPGETFDISKTIFGSGIVTFNESGSDITLKDVKIETPNSVFDSTLTQSLGLMLCRQNGNVNEYNIHLDGDCTIKNSYFDESINSSGITFGTYLYSDDEEAEVPLIRFDGNGKLNLSGGTDVIYTEADVEFNTDAAITAYKDHFCDGIVCHNLYVEPGRHLKFKVNGTGIESQGQIFARKGSVIDIETKAPHVSVGDTNKAAMFLYGLLTMTGAKINIHCQADSNQFIPYNSELGAFGGIIFSESGAIEAENSSILIDFKTVAGKKDYAHNYFGILDSGEQGSIVLDNSDITIRLNSKNVTDSNGIYLLGNMIMQKGSRITCNMHNKGIVRALASEGNISIKNSDINVNVSSYDKKETYGILCNKAEFDLSNTKYKILSKANGGMAFGANTGKKDKKKQKYDSSYKSSKVKFVGNTICSSPRNCTISLSSVPGSMNYIRVETFYDLLNTKKPAQEIKICKVNRASNTIKVKGKTVTLRGNILKKKSQVIARNKAISLSNAKGIVIYNKVNVNKKKYEKYFIVNQKTGKITVKKGVAKGAYIIKVKVKAFGNNKYKPAEKTANVTIKVK
ncbi:hypothetical protein SAMN05216249_12025 [Acetitomaculum ruminis DSM 5522]|uniref:Ig-like domain-containing protein n=1 Tax=Acetitomaculum ruminis DSM 5522 TaxID=1120918 RepID=A0A1I1A3W6_9FIRM|nr:hypothetical protein [Acetitomaculum ruminis]SFB32046.1 hypothetical protein SAMN05216249_12025 [Acetitomaculum ruminis DSM 5522]